MATQNDVTEYKHGEMDITEQTKTMTGFIRVLTWGAILSLAVLVFLALTNA